MKTITNIFLFAAMLLFAACSQEEEIPSSIDPAKEMRFAASIDATSTLQTRASSAPLGYGHGDLAIKMIGKETEPNDTCLYEVKSGFIGQLLPKGEKGHDWADKTTDVYFRAWTAPKRVSLTAGSTSGGTVDFGTNNADLEHFIGASATANYSNISTTVTLSFKHLVSKLTFEVLKDSEGQTINSAQIVFTAINKVGTFTIDATESDKIPEVTKQVSDNSNQLALECKKEVALYLPPVSFNTSTGDGDFYIVYGGTNYYGTLNGLKVEDKDAPSGYKDLAGLNAGEHLVLKMQLTAGNGIGIGPSIADWEYKDNDEIHGNAAKGIYTYEQLKQLATSVNAGTGIPDALKSTDGSVRLYKNITVDASWTAIGTGSAFSGTFDGNGYTISGFSGAGLFGEVGTTSPNTIKNVSLSGSATGTSGTIGLLAGSTKNTTIENCHVIGASSVTNAGATATAGGLIGTAGTGTTLSNCSVETTGTISGTTAGALVGDFQGTSISNCFAIFEGASGVKLIGTDIVTPTYSYYWNTLNSSTSGSFWGTSSETGTISFDANVFNITVTIGVADPTSLLDALNKDNADSFKGWVYVYGKDYPVFRINAATE